MTAPLCSMRCTRLLAHRIQHDSRVHMAAQVLVPDGLLSRCMRRQQAVFPDTLRAACSLPTPTMSVQEDRPHGGLNPHHKHYYLPAPGGYKLQDGMLVPFPSALSPPVMLVRGVCALAPTSSM